MRCCGWQDTEQEDTAMVDKLYAFLALVLVFWPIVNKLGG